MNWKRLGSILSWRLIGPVAVVAVIAWAGPRQVWEVITRADPTLIAAAVALAVPLTILRGIRWRLLLGAQQIALTYRESICMYAIGMVIGAVTPGRIDTPMIWDVSAEVNEQYIRNIPLARLGSAAEVADGILFLLSDQASYITGMVMDINGGLGMFY